jgi:hypothetical protein
MKERLQRDRADVAAFTSIAGSWMADHQYERFDGATAFRDNHTFITEASIQLFCAGSLFRRAGISAPDGRRAAVLCHAAIADRRTVKNYTFGRVRLTVSFQARLLDVE